MRDESSERVDVTSHHLSPESEPLNNARSSTHERVQYPVTILGERADRIASDVRMKAGRVCIEGVRSSRSVFGRSHATTETVAGFLIYGFVDQRIEFDC